MGAISAGAVGNARADGSAGKGVSVGSDGDSGTV
jgi:hypothetical protein